VNTSEHVLTQRVTATAWLRVRKIPMSERNRRLVKIPKFLWHEEHGVGNTDVVVIDLPTIPGARPVGVVLDE
jgi:hypothetical protein